MNKDEKQAFILSAAPTAVQAKFPFEYTLQWRMGPSKWHLSAVKMTKLEANMFRLASEVRAFEHEVKELNVPTKQRT